MCGFLIYNIQMHSIKYKPVYVIVSPVYVDSQIITKSKGIMTYVPWHTCAFNTHSNTNARNQNYHVLYTDNSHFTSDYSWIWTGQADIISAPYSVDKKKLLTTLGWLNMIYVLFWYISYHPHPDHLRHRLQMGFHSGS